MSVPVGRGQGFSGRMQADSIRRRSAPFPQCCQDFAFIIIVGLFEGCR